MQIEDVTGVGFTARRTAQQQGDLTVGNGLLGQVIEYDQRIFTAVAEELTHGATGVGCQELQGSRLGSGSGNDDGVGQSAMLFQLAHHVGDGRLLLTHRNVDTLDATVFLVDDRVDRHGGLTDLTVTDDQLTLATADRNHRVNRLVTGLYRLVDRLTPDHTRRDFLDGVGQLGFDRALAIDRVTQSIDYATQQFRTYRHFQDTTGALGFHTFSQSQVVTQDNGTHGVLLQVQCHTVDTTRELDHFAVHYVSQTVDAHNTVRNADDGADIAGLGLHIELLDALFDYFTNLGRIQLLHTMSLKSGFQRLGQLGKLAADRTVDDQVTRTNQHTANKGRIDGHMRSYCAFQPLG